MRHGSSGTLVLLYQLAVSSRDRPLYLCTRPVEGQGQCELAGFWRWGALHQKRIEISDVAERRVSGLVHQKEPGVSTRIRHTMAVLFIRSDLLTTCWSGNLLWILWS